MSEAGEQCEALARNLIDTLGPDRAMHVAQQFGWYGVAAEISRLNRTPTRLHPADTAPA